MKKKKKTHRITSVHVPPVCLISTVRRYECAGNCLLLELNDYNAFELFLDEGLNCV